ncbi:archaeosortase/exosortase family protein [Mariniflexile litorale]|uniref:Archaeosortase/exosortase family protein n=1 Tax=Mariniflexile litorale TaxID=3045158 RepID=A0AAU7EE82_9FLAO|nr:archaeosortase/exosortase family protein [Mariniflexile sp. KMM 9835]MDQ8213355.1 archaeosortase/exosortase family protein [Mariniflexile sp. KMM 9835]
MKQFNSFKNQIPLPIRLFLGKALLFFIVWKIIYGIFFYNSNSLDNTLTTHVAEASTFVLNNLSFMSGFSTQTESYSEAFGGELIEYRASTIYHHDYKVLNIADACNGLELMILYIGFIICMPSKILRKVLYIVIGLLILDLVNILRCVGLIYLREYFHTYFQFAHHYLFKIIVYSTTFLIWVFYTRKIHLKNEPVPVG